MTYISRYVYETQFIQTKSNRGFSSITVFVKNHAGIVRSVAERHFSAEAGVYKFFWYYEETNVVVHLHARAKEFFTYDVISGGAFQATERTEKIGNKHIPII